MDLSASLTAADVENEDNDEGDLEVGVVADLEEEGDDDQRRGSPPGKTCILPHPPVFTQFNKYRK